MEVDIGKLERIARELVLLLVTHLTVADTRRPAEVENVVDVLEVHGDALEAIGELGGDGCEIDAPGLLEVGELSDLLTVEEHLPADSPGTQGGRLPVVLFESHVVHRRIDANGLEAAEVEILDVGGGWLQDHLKLLVLVEAVGVLSITTVRRAAGGLHVGHLPRSRTEDSAGTSRGAWCPPRPRHPTAGG